MHINIDDVMFNYSMKSYLDHNMSKEQYLRNLNEQSNEKNFKEIFVLPIVVNEIINNHVESSIDICPVFTL